MWKMQSLERTLTLVQLAPFFMLSPKGLLHQWNYKHELFFKNPCPICCCTYYGHFAIMNEMYSKCAKIVVCTYPYVQFAIFLIMRLNIFFMNLWKNSLLKCSNYKMTLYTKFILLFVCCFNYFSIEILEPSFNLVLEVYAPKTAM